MKVLYFFIISSVTSLLYRDNIYSAFGNEEVNFLFKFGKNISPLGELTAIMGVTTDSQDRIIVADTGNHRIQIFDSDGNFISKFGSLCNVAPGSECVVPEPKFSWDVFNKWAGYSADTISDKEFLEHVKIDGEKIPSWVKKHNSKWIKDGLISHDDLIIMLDNLKTRGII